MSELRWRSGKKAPPKAKTNSATLTEHKDGVSNLSQEETERLLDSMMLKIQDAPAPGLSHLAKSCKDELRDDPYNLNLILELGMAYAKDKQWDRCANVMLRGWKRVNEFEQHELRCQFLIVLCQASLSRGKFRQAMAVLSDVEEPAEEHASSIVEALRCNVYCSNGDASAGLKAFHKAIKGQDFDLVLAIWGNCYAALKRVGACEAAKSAIEALAVDELMKTKIKLAEMVGNLDLKRSCTEDDRAKSKALFGWLCLVSLGLFLAVACYWLQGLEARNLQRLKIRP